MTAEEFLVLNSIYLRKIATAKVVKECSALPSPTIESTLSAAQSDGAAFAVGEGQFMLSDDGTKRVLEEYTARYSEHRGDGPVERWYQRFEVLNGQFLAAISAWQSQGDDPAKFDRLLKLVDRQIKALGTVTDIIARYGIYRDRFEAATNQVDQGRSEFIVSPHVDSIHNIWFEFHEDILTVLGRPRDVAESP